ncbi:ubiquitin carboxyl-terminal hydrolase 16 [Denticeps clupeoides]|uniref:Ubiquitin carboxyl-terminal hydrolase n=1 Tax=Denticeps clupeoides TaxID=299321 RepID=A0AAY4AX02_9TELE|nr:ubiquitin carboxyl-terminal hydrolase 16 [Denticeps clupeoides]XP_028856673.1 ubiquitin carboxyl-terminal hydrolase 16 [Denticeps clupeoides]
MGKKKGKERSLREESPVDQTGPLCPHVRRGIDPVLLKKTAGGVDWSSCQDCRELSSTPSSEEGVPVIWMCLKCGHRGCGRGSPNQHAIKHNATPHSDLHCLVLNLESWAVWCYACDDEARYSSTGQMAQLVTNVQKQVASGDCKRSAPAKVKEARLQEEMKLEDEREKREKKILKNDDKLEQSSEALESSAAGGVPVKGLSNLGNTCFFNAVLQNLSQTQLLRKILRSVTDEKTSLSITPPLSTELSPIEVQLERPGSLTLAMCHLLNEIQETKKGMVTPRDLFTQVCKKAARFKGFQQQDSQELLRYLLDGMRAEEMKRMNSGIVEALKISGKMDDSTKSLVKEYEKNGAPRNFVDRVFGGELTSTVMCKECRTVSSVTEMFLDLSLPVSDEAYKKKNQKKVIQKNSFSSDGRGSPVSLANEKDDIPTGTGSKYQQKKAKKQAKKQAKNQRRQQKQGGKLTLDDLMNQETEVSSQAEAAGASEPEKGTEDVPGPQSDVDPTTEQELVNVNGSLESKEGGEDSAEDSQPIINRFLALSEDRDMDNETENITAEEDEEEAAGKTSPAGELVEDLDHLKIETSSGYMLPTLENGDVLAETREYVVVNQDPDLAFQTLAPRVTPEKQECSIFSCLFQFTEVEELTQNNSLLCITCTKRQSCTRTSEGLEKNVYRDALKQMLISSLPSVLTLHLKRFQQVGYSVCKVNSHVRFPHVLDLAPFCSLGCEGVLDGQGQAPYRLYGLVEHSGTMRSGHYTAYVRTRPQGSCDLSKGSWFHVSDSSVHPVTEAKVQSSQAYLLFYERTSSAQMKEQSSLSGLHH